MKKLILVKIKEMIKKKCFNYFLFAKKAKVFICLFVNLNLKNLILINFNFFYLLVFFIYLFVYLFIYLFIFFF